jgi:hypothetical protein
MDFLRRVHSPQKILDVSYLAVFVDALDLGLELEVVPFFCFMSGLRWEFQQFGSGNLSVKIERLVLSPHGDHFFGEFFCH